MLSKGWSPELIAGRLKREHPHWDTVSHEAIYQWIYSERPDLVGYLSLNFWDDLKILLS